MYSWGGFLIDFTLKTPENAVITGKPVVQRIKQVKMGDKSTLQRDYNQDPTSLSVFWGLIYAISL